MIKLRWMQYHYDFFFQADLIGGGGAGKLTAVNVNGAPYTFPFNITNAPQKPGFMANPHGVSVWKDPKTGTCTVTEFRCLDVIKFERENRLCSGRT